MHLHWPAETQQCVIVKNDNNNHLNQGNMALWEVRESQVVQNQTLLVNDLPSYWIRITARIEEVPASIATRQVGSKPLRKLANKQELAIKAWKMNRATRNIYANSITTRTLLIRIPIIINSNNNRRENQTNNNNHINSWTKTQFKRKRWKLT